MFIPFYPRVPLVTEGDILATLFVSHLLPIPAPILKVRDVPLAVLRALGYSAVTNAQI